VEEKEEETYTGRKTTYHLKKVENLPVGGDDEFAYWTFSKGLGNFEGYILM